MSIPPIINLREPEVPNAYPVQLQVRSHTFRSDVWYQFPEARDSAPGPTRLLRRSAGRMQSADGHPGMRGNIRCPLERVEARVERGRFRGATPANTF